jgi:tryptophan synthase alpha chain
MNRIQERFARLAKDSRKGLVIYIGAGDPDLDHTCRLALAMDKAGADVLELGVPFSDPLADGLVNQLAAQRGLASGTTPSGILDCVAHIRTQSQIPIVLYVYYNLIHHFGPQKFIERAAKAGVDGLLVLDLPPEESSQYVGWMSAAGLSPIFLIAPTTPDSRIDTIVGHAAGFIYYVSREGVTGMQAKVSTDIGAMITKIRTHTSLPIAVGFGVSSPEQARVVAASADAVVVGSAVVNRIAQGGTNSDMVEKVSGFVGELSRAVKSV